GKVTGGMARPSARVPIARSALMDPCIVTSENRPMFKRSLEGLSRRKDTVEETTDKARPDTAEDILLDLASRIDSDGGMPGKNPESRAIATVIAVLAFLSQGHSP